MKGCIIVNPVNHLCMIQKFSNITGKQAHEPILFRVNTQTQLCSALIFICSAHSLLRQPTNTATQQPSQHAIQSCDTHSNRKASRHRNGLARLFHPKTHPRQRLHRVRRRSLPIQMERELIPRNSQKPSSSGRNTSSERHKLQIHRFVPIQTSRDASCTS